MRRRSGSGRSATTCWASIWAWLVGETVARTGSLIAAVEVLRGQPGRTLRPYEVPDLSSVEEWLADNEVLDPEGPDEMFEAFSQRKGLFRRLRRH